MRVKRLLNTLYYHEKREKYSVKCVKIRDLRKKCLGKNVCVMYICDKRSSLPYIWDQVEARSH